MSPIMAETPSASGARDPLADVGHPRGTLAIVLIFAALFTLGWFGLYLFRFMERGAPHH